jgi:hypothetical protein
MAKHLVSKGWRQRRLEYRDQSPGAGGAAGLPEAIEEENRGGDAGEDDGEGGPAVH